jgi:hypothetical protein
VFYGFDSRTHSCSSVYSGNPLMEIQTHGHKTSCPRSIPKKIPQINHSFDSTPRHPTTTHGKVKPVPLHLQQMLPILCVDPTHKPGIALLHVSLSTAAMHHGCRAYRVISHQNSSEQCCYQRRSSHSLPHDQRACYSRIRRAGPFEKL